MMKFISDFNTVAANRNEYVDLIKKASRVLEALYLDKKTLIQLYGRQPAEELLENFSISITMTEVNLNKNVLTMQQYHTFNQIIRNMETISKIVK